MTTDSIDRPNNNNDHSGVVSMEEEEEEEEKKDSSWMGDDNIDEDESASFDSGHEYETSDDDEVLDLNVDDESDLEDETIGVNKEERVDDAEEENVVEDEYFVEEEVLEDEEDLDPTNTDEDPVETPSSRPPQQEQKDDDDDDDDDDDMHESQSIHSMVEETSPSFSPTNLDESSKPTTTESVMKHLARQKQPPPIPQQQEVQLPHSSPRQDRGALKPEPDAVKIQVRSPTTHAVASSSSSISNSPEKRARTIKRPAKPIDPPERFAAAAAAVDNDNDDHAKIRMDKSQEETIRKENNESAGHDNGIEDDELKGTATNETTIVNQKETIMKEHGETAGQEDTAVSLDEIPAVDDDGNGHNHSDDMRTEEVDTSPLPRQSTDERSFDSDEYTEETIDSEREESALDVKRTEEKLPTNQQLSPICGAGDDAEESINENDKRTEEATEVEEEVSETKKTASSAKHTIPVESEDLSATKQLIEAIHDDDDDDDDDDSAIEGEGSQHAGRQEDPPDAPSQPSRSLSSAPDRTSLHEMIRQKDWSATMNRLEELQNEDPFLVFRELTAIDPKRQETPLHVALAKAPQRLNTLMIRLIPTEFQDDILMALDAHGNAPLHVACENLEIDPKDKRAFASIVKLLTVGGARAHAVQNKNGDFPLYLLLMSSAMRSDVAGKFDDVVESLAKQLVETILNKNPSLIHERNDMGATLLHAAASNCVHDKVWRILLEVDGGTSVAKLSDHHGMLPLHYLASCTSGQIPSAECARRLVDAYPMAILHPSSTGDTPLHLLVSNIASWVKNEKELKDENTATLIKLLFGENGPGDKSPLLMKNVDSLSPLHCCVRFHAPINVAAAMMDNDIGVKASLMVDSEGATPLHLACASPDPRYATILVPFIGTKEAAVALDNNGKTPLIVAIENDHCTKQLIQALGILNPEAAKAVSSKGRTPFHIAIRKRANEGIVKAVLKMHPKAVKEVFEGGNNIFHEMCQYNTASSIIAGLLQVHPDGSRAQNVKGNLPLHVAAAYSLSPSVIDALVEVYPDGCMVQNNSKDIALHYAVGNKNADEGMVSILLKAAPESILAKDKNGKTALDRAKEAEVDAAVYKLLRASYRGNSNSEPTTIDNEKSKREKNEKQGLDDSQTSIDLVAAESDSSLKKKEKRKKKQGSMRSSRSIDSAGVGNESFHGEDSLHMPGEMLKSEEKKKARKGKRGGKEGSISSVRSFDLSGDESESFKGDESLHMSSNFLQDNVKKKGRKKKSDNDSVRALVAADTAVHDTVKKNSKSLHMSAAFLQDSPKKKSNKKKSTIKDDQHDSISLHDTNSDGEEERVGRTMNVSLASLDVLTPNDKKKRRVAKTGEQSLASPSSKSKLTRKKEGFVKKSPGKLKGRKTADANPPQSPLNVTTKVRSKYAEAEDLQLSFLHTPKDRKKKHSSSRSVASTGSHKSSKSKSKGKTPTSSRRRLKKELADAIASKGAEKSSNAKKAKALPSKSSRHKSGDAATMTGTPKRSKKKSNEDHKPSDHSSPMLPDLMSSPSRQSQQRSTSHLLKEILKTPQQAG